jgi:hypothetical protein
MANEIGSVRGLDAKPTQYNAASGLEQISRPAMAALRAVVRDAD